MNEPGGPERCRLAVVSGGLRKLFEERGEEPPEGGSRAMGPVNVRAR